MKLFGEHGILDILLNGNGKEAKLREAEQRAHQAHVKHCETLEAAGLRTAELTQKAAELAFEDDSRVDVQAVVREVEREMSCSADDSCEECDEPAETCPVALKLMKEPEAA